MPVPTLTGPAERLYTFYSPWAGDDEDNGYGWAWLAAMFGEAHTDVEDVIRDGPSGLPGWARLFNVLDEDDAPDWTLPRTSRYAGYSIPSGEAPATTRLRLRPDSNKKATTAAMVAAVKPLLAGDDPAVRVIERDPTAYQHTLITLTSQTPDPDAVEAVLADPKIKAVGHWWTLVVSDSPLINEGTLTIDAVPETIDAAVLGDIT
jgi:hypothetical protein